MRKEFLIYHYIWDKKNDKPYNVFLDYKTDTTIFISWFDKYYNPTRKGIKMIKQLEDNNKKEIVK